MTLTREQGQDIVSVAITDGGCGPLRAVLDTVAEKLGSQNSPIVSLPLAIVNTDSWQLATAQLISWPDSLELTEPASLPGTPLTWANPDSIAPSGAAELPNARIWHFVSPVIDSAGNQQFARKLVQVATHKDVTQFRVRIWMRGAALADQVPMTPPDRRPDDLYANYDSARGVPIDVLGVQFHIGTSHADRIAAIDAVAGEVIGGIPYSGSAVEGFYYVRIQSDGVTESLRPMRDTLKARPQVLNAELLISTEPAYRLPANEQLWMVRPVDVDTTLSSWGFTAINAPLAWGCEVGESTTVRIGVVDVGFRSPPGIISNLLNHLTPVHSHQHGLNVASIIAATGPKMSGVMWNAAVSYYQPPVASAAREPDHLETILAMLNAIENGERVINISSGRKYLNDPVEDFIQSLELAALAKSNLLQVQQKGFALPLIVIAAGNPPTSDAQYSGFPQIKNDFPDNVMVAAAASRNGFDAQGRVPLWTDNTTVATTGHLIDVAAPGEHIYVLGATSDGQQDSVSVDSGSSLAAPFVTGVAGLLLSFNPSLTPKELRDLIVASALSSGRSAYHGVESYPFLDAYGALKLAASQSNSLPLCGTRLANVGDTIFAERAGSWEPMIEEADGGWLNAYHGGHNLTVEGSVGLSHFVLQGGAWSSQLQAPNLDAGGAFHSKYARSHDGDSTVALVMSGTSTYAISVGVSGGGGTAQFPHTITLAPRQEGPSYCARWRMDWGCVGDTWLERYEERVGYRGAFMTDARFGQAQVGVYFEIIADRDSVGEPYTCDGDTCRNFVRTRRTLRTENYRVDRQTGVWTLVSTVPYRAAYQALSEDGAELIQPRSIPTITSTTYFQPGTFQPVFHSRTAETDCAVDFLAWDDEVLLTSTPTVPLCFERIQSSTVLDSITKLPSVNGTISP